MPPERDLRLSKITTSPRLCAMKATNIQEKLDLFTEQWSPKKIGELNGQQILLAKIEGEFVFHKHDHEDELFMVLKGQLSLELRDRTIIVNPGEFYTVPKGVEHKPGQSKSTMMRSPLTPASI